MTANEIANAAWGESEPEPFAWVSGPWALELRGDELADLRYDGTVVLRSVRAVARDQNWGTVPSVVESLDASDGRLLIAIGMRGLGADISATVTVSVRDDRLSVELNATVNDDFQSNRLGLVVLHPPGVAGASLAVISPSGAITATAFPEPISPHQPAFDIARLEWSAGGLASSLRFTGDVFEMEDQRNWTDASYKTYSTPLALPFPVLIEAGNRIDQSIELSSHSEGRLRRHEANETGETGEANDPDDLNDPDDPVVLRRGLRPVPQFTTSASTASGTVPPDVESSATAVLIELDARTANWPAALDRAVVEASGRPLDVRLVVDAVEQLDPLLEALEALEGVPIVRLGAFSTATHLSDPELWHGLTSRASGRSLGLAGGVDLIGGTRAHFTELNRNAVAMPADADGVTFSITPQMHATNRYQLVESIAMQRVVAENAVALAAGARVHIGPITLKARFNAVATTSPGIEVGPDGSADLSHGYGAELVDGATDPRQASPALAAWTIASAAALSVRGVASVSYFESWGVRGTHGLPAQRAMDWLAGLSGAPLLEVAGTVPTGVWILAGEVGDGTVALVANISDGDATVTIDLEGRETTVRIAALSAARVPLG